ncbi:putative esterase [Trypanosoma grayi]|uniref:putative esterase n=1 Tax=Trypanosoma grayi TaxID=71804 RepID=UPI0004F46610|nr:putative esterase [Trypanosoma grayi]KEG10127.1 putative esterase [Trypanosoma grayi]
MNHILLLGDSLTQQGYLSGWVSRLSNCYIRRADVVNRGLSGYNSRWVLDILKDDARRVHLLPSNISRPLFVTVLLGSNDAAATGQKVPLEEYKENLKAIIALVREHAAPIGGIFLLAPPPVDDEARSCWMRNVGRDPDVCGRGLVAVRSYRNAALQVGAEENAAHKDVTVIDLYRVILGDGADTMPYSKGPWCEYFYDGLHFNEAGGQLVFEALWDAIQKSAKAQEILPEALPYVLPPHDTLWAAGK